MWVNANVPAAVLGGSKNNGKADEGPCRVRQGICFGGTAALLAMASIPGCRVDRRYFAAWSVSVHGPVSAWALWIPTPPPNYSRYIYIAVLVSYNPSY